MTYSIANLLPTSTDLGALQWILCADAVADTVLADLLTHVHDERGTCGKGQNNDESMPEVCLSNQIVASEQDIIGVTLEKTQRNTQITGDG